MKSVRKLTAVPPPHPDALPTRDDAKRMAAQWLLEILYGEDYNPFIQKSVPVVTDGIVEYWQQEQIFNPNGPSLEIHTKMNNYLLTTVFDAVEWPMPVTKPGAAPLPSKTKANSRKDRGGLSVHSWVELAVEWLLRKPGWVQSWPFVFGVMEDIVDALKALGAPLCVYDPNVAKQHPYGPIRTALNDIMKNYFMAVLNGSRVFYRLPQERPEATQPASVTICSETGTTGAVALALLKDSAPVLTHVGTDRLKGYTLHARYPIDPAALAAYANYCVATKRTNIFG